MKPGRVPTKTELAFIFTGHPKPAGFWASGFGRLVCRALGHDSPHPAAAFVLDPLPRVIAHSLIWGCPRCGVRFVHTFTVPNPIPADFDNARLSRIMEEHMRQLYLDVLFEMNRGRRLVLRGPVRSLPEFEADFAPISVAQSTHGLSLVPPPAN